MNGRIARVAVLLAFALIAVFVGKMILSSRTVSYVSLMREIMATPVTVTAAEPVAPEIADIVFRIFEETDRAMSEWKPESPLTAVNQAAGRQPVKVPDELIATLQHGIEIGDLTDGAFDITWAALWGTWDFKSETPRIPADRLIDEKVALVNYRDIVIDQQHSTVFLPRPGMVIGLGGIAKGTALKRAVATLVERGFDSFLISAGGQVVVHGWRQDRPWRIGIRDPRGEMDDSFARLELVDTSAATSGDYERFFILDGVRYHHILDPRTGRVSRGLRSVTVICSDAERADALSTAMMVLGREGALALAARLNDVEVVLVDAEGEMHVSAGISDQLEILHPPRP